MRKEILWSAMLAAAMMVGCDGNDTTTPSQPPAPRQPTNPPPTPSASDTNKATDAMKDAGTKMGDTMKDAGTKMSDTAKDAGNKASDTMKDMSSSTAPAAGAASDASSDAQSKVAQVITYIKENKLDAADKTLKGLEDNKDSLPASVASQLPALRTQLNAAKAGGGVSLPGMSK
jgi:gas vesicle protein